MDWNDHRECKKWCAHFISLEHFQLRIFGLFRDMMTSYSAIFGNAQGYKSARIDFLYPHESQTQDQSQKLLRTAVQGQQENCRLAVGLLYVISPTCLLTKLLVLSTMYYSTITHHKFDSLLCTTSKTTSCNKGLRQVTLASAFDIVLGP